jgi:hypothetical protein
MIVDELVALLWFWLPYLLLFNFWYLRHFTTEGQPESIVQDIENMVRAYVDKVKKIISVACY